MNIIEYTKTNFKEVLDQDYDSVEGIPNFDWENNIYTSSFYKWAHLEHYKNKKVEVLHLVVMPYAYCDMPIFGLDVVSINSKITMICCDFTPTVKNSYTVQHPFINDRKLPEWANFFSDNLLLIKPTTEDQTEYILEYFLREFEAYKEKLYYYGKISEPAPILKKQREYVFNQRKNTSTLKALSADIGEKRAELFVNTYLFPDVYLSDKEKKIQKIFDFGKNIKYATSIEHDDAEQTDLSVDLITGAVSDQNYSNYLYSQMEIFRKLSKYKGKANPVVKSIYNLMKEDYEKLNVKTNRKSSKALKSYVKYLSSQDDKVKAAHIYTLVLAHYYGGSYIARNLKYPKKHLTNIPDMDAFLVREDTYGCNVEEVRKAFLQVTKIYNDIYLQNE